MIVDARIVLDGLYVYKCDFGELFGAIYEIQREEHIVTKLYKDLPALHEVIFI